MTIDDEIKGRFRNEYHRGMINLTYTANQINYDLLQYFKRHNITEAQYNVLRVLHGYKNEDPVSLNFLKERMLDKSPDVSRIVDRLFDQGFLDRKENKNDRRVKDIQITNKGIELIKEMSDCDIKTDNMLKNLSINEINELNILLDKIRG